MIEQIKTHKDTIQVGDVILYNGKETTVCKKDIKHDRFMGRSIFGSAYPIVTKVIYYRMTPRGKVTA